MTQIFKYLQQVILQLEKRNKANMLRDLSRRNTCELVHESYVRVSQLSSEIFQVGSYNNGPVRQSWQKIT